MHEFLFCESMYSIKNGADQYITKQLYYIILYCTNMLFS